MEETRRMLELVQTENLAKQGRAKLLAIAQSICQLRKSIQEAERKSSGIQKQIEEAEKIHIRLIIEEGVAKKQQEILSKQVQDKMKTLEQHNQELNASHRHVWGEYKTATANIKEALRRQNDTETVHQKRALLQLQESEMQKKVETEKRKVDIKAAAEIEIMEKLKLFQERKLEALSKYLEEALVEAVEIPM